MQLKAIHIAACKSDLATLKALVEVLNADINVHTFDESNALHCAIANHASPEVVQYLVDKGCNINQQIYPNPGWQSNMPYFAGFTPLMMAVNNDDMESVMILLRAKQIVPVVKKKSYFFGWSWGNDEDNEGGDDDNDKEEEEDEIGADEEAEDEEAEDEKEKEEEEKETKNEMKEVSIDTEICTGPLEANRFPMKGNYYFEVHEYEGQGYRFNALHIACSVENDAMISKLLEVGHANSDSRVLLPRADDVERLGLVDLYDDESDRKHPLLDEDNSNKIALGLNTPLHICSEGSESALILMKSTPSYAGASLLSQNMMLNASWERHRESLPEWLLTDQRLNLEATVVALCKAKNLPVDCSLYITEFYVSLYLAEHFERSYKQEMSSICWPWMALSLTKPVDVEEDNDESEVASAWSIYRPAIKNALLRERVGLENDSEFTPVKEFVGVELKKSKTIKYRELFGVLTEALYAMDLFSNKGNDDDIDMNVEDDEDGDDNSLDQEKKRRRI